jgi:hypothetical protein
MYDIYTITSTSRAQAQASLNFITTQNNFHIKKNRKLVTCATKFIPSFSKDVFKFGFSRRLCFD